MTTSLTAAVFLFFIAVGLIHHVNMLLVAPPEDQEGSGSDLEGSGSGSGGWSHEGEMKNNQKVRTLATNTKDGDRNPLQGYQELDFDQSQFVILPSRSFLKNQQIINALIAGGVTGVTLAAALAATLIYLWHKKDNRGYVLRQKRASDEDYHRSKPQQAAF